ncbi:MAG TPA: Mrp/NBP35 family ATP-binding protein [Rhodothermales bacterium]
MSSIMEVTPESVLQALTDVLDPERQQDIVRLNTIRALNAGPDGIAFTILLNDLSPGFRKQAADRARDALVGRFGSGVRIQIETETEMIPLGDDLQISAQGAPQSDVPPGIRSYVAVASGKGGVGKSTVAVNLAVALADAGYNVGLLDADVYGPSIPTMFGITDRRPRVNERKKIVPLEAHGVKLLSMGLLVDPSQAVIWRGPMVSRAIRQFLSDAEWGELDFLILDLPPGTGDIQLTVVQTIPLTGAVIVSTPQEVALADARKGVAMFANVNVPVFGIIENMAYFSPPDQPERRYYLFGEGGARRLADELGVPLLGAIPLEQSVREGGDAGRPIVVEEPESASSRAFAEVAASLRSQVMVRNATQPATRPVEILHR